VLDNINLQFEQGKIYGVLGRNGAGKTTLVNIITNRAFATNGIIEIDGGCSYENDKIQEKVFCITEKSAYPSLENASALFKWASRFYPNFDINYALKLAERFDLEINKKYGKLSTGYTTIAKVVLTLASNAPYMIFDEPVLGIDAIYREVFYDELKKKHKELKNTIIVCSHILDEVESVVDDVIILKKGHIVFNGRINEITKKQSLQDFYLELHKKDEKPQTKTTQVEKLKPQYKIGKVDFKKVKNSALYLFRITWAHALIILALCVLFTILPLFIKEIDLGIEMMVVINLFILAMGFHGYFFKYALYNGISRRTYFIAVCKMLFVSAIVFSLLASFSIMIVHFATDMQIIVKGFYSGLFSPFNFASFITVFAWVLMANVFFMFLALFSMVLYQTLARKGRYIAMTILIAIILGFVLWGTLATNSLANMLLFLGGIKPNLSAWFAVMWFTILGAVFGVITWLILRKTEVK